MVLKELIFNSFYFGWVVVSKELTFNSFYFGWVWQFLNNQFLTYSTLGGCGGLKETDFLQFLFWEECSGLQRTDF